jgi:DNA uptake protein ComE-like DNA-binding protein
VEGFLKTPNWIASGVVPAQAAGGARNIGTAHVAIVDSELNKFMIPASNLIVKLSRRLALTVAGCLFLASQSQAAEWQTFKNCRLIDNPSNDGDSFHVQAGDKQLIVRLYFVDCPETSAATDADAKRVREQSWHFGLVEMRRVLHYGEEARKFTAQALAKPFTLHTAFATALGRSAMPRIYGMITTAEGNDLGKLLVEKGLARAYGSKRRTFDGISGEEMGNRLQDLELQAMMQRVGIWSETDPTMLAKFREKERDEEEELKELRDQLNAKPSGLVDLNTSTAGELQSVSGIGTVLAARIIEGRPYQSVDDLLRVRGISRSLLDRLRPAVTVSNSSPEKPAAAK